MKLLSTVLSAASLIAASSAAQWQIVNPRILTVAMGVTSPDNKNIYATGGGGAGGLASIVKSEDEGYTWEELPHDQQLVYLDIDVAPGTTFGASVAAGLFGVYSGLSFTRDGRNFQSIPEKFLAFGGQNVRAIDSQTFYTVAYWQRVIGSSGEGVVATFDGAKSFEFFDWGQEIPVRYGAFPSNTTWYLTGGRFPASSSSDSKLSFGKEKQITSRISIVSTEEGYKQKLNLRPLPSSGNKDKADYEGSIVRTTDGGKTFQQVYYDAGLYYFNAIDCVDEVTCWAVAEGPLGAWIFHTKNGVDWFEQYQKYDISLLDIQMENALEGWAVGGNVAIGLESLFLRTTDGGKTWINSNGNISNVYPTSVSTASEGRAYATALVTTGGAAILAYK